MKIDFDPAWTRQEIADRFRCTTRTVDRMAEKHKWTPIVVDGWRILYRQAEVLKLLEVPRRRIGRPPTLFASAPNLTPHA